MLCCTSSSCSCCCIVAVFLLLRCLIDYKLLWWIRYNVCRFNYICRLDHQGSSFCHFFCLLFHLSNLLFLDVGWFAANTITCFCSFKAIMLRIRISWRFFGLSTTATWTTPPSTWRIVACWTISCFIFLISCCCLTSMLFILCYLLLWWASGRIVLDKSLLVLVCCNCCLESISHGVVENSTFLNFILLLLLLLLL